MLSLRMGIDHFRANRKRCSVVNIFTCRFKKMTHAKKNTISTLLDYPGHSGRGSSSTWVINKNMLVGLIGVASVL